MKTKLQLLGLLIFCMGVTQAQETSATVSMDGSYVNKVYYKLSTETETSFARDSWDLAFLRTSAFEQAIRINDGLGIQVFEASSTIADWSTIDVANEGTWTALHNSETSWAIGAFDTGSATYGWGEYNPGNHHVTGSIIFVLKYGDGTYKKLIIEDFYGGYTIKYSSWDGSTWSSDTTTTIANTSNPNNTFNYYSLTNDTEVVTEPSSAGWDFVFTKYATDYYGDGTLYYGVTGVLHSADVTIAKNDESSSSDVSNLDYSDEINTIGYDWKSFNGTGYDVDSDLIFYVKYSDGTIYRVYFTAFEGAGTGNISFNFEDVTSTMSVDDYNQISLGVFPNPSADKKINLVYDLNSSIDKNSVSIYNVTGAKVFETSLLNNAGFYDKQLDLSSLKTGIYLLNFKSGDFQVTKKIVLQ